MKINNQFLFKRSNQRTIYSLLLVATPFLLLQNYLQSFIGSVSGMEIRIFDYKIPVIPLLAMAIIVALVIMLRKKITVNRIAGWSVIFLMFGIGQYFTDFYFHHRFYDLQYNWHYLAYSVFAYLNYRFLKEKNADNSKILLNTFITAFFISLFDEIIQIPLSNRIFDIGDVAKDLWGTLIGLTFVFAVIENGKIFKNPLKLRHPGIKDYLSDELSLYFYLFLFDLLFLMFTSVLTDTKYLFQAFVFPAAVFFLLFSLVHISQFKAGKWLTFFVVALFLTGTVFLQIKYRNKGVFPVNEHLFIYKGFPVYYLDIMIFPGGTFRPVDKKDFFNQRDKKTIKAYSQDILLVSSGTRGKGGKGFLTGRESDFVYNEYRKKGLQIIVQDNFLAFKTYNRLAKEGKKITFIIKND
jgi:hypothetical protein